LTWHVPLTTLSKIDDTDNSVRATSLSPPSKLIGRGNLGRFYRYVNGKLSCKSGVGPLKSGFNKIIVSDVEKAELLNNYFSSVFTIDDGVFPKFCRRVDNDTFISEINFFSAEIVKAITQIKDAKSADTHGFNNCFLKRLKFILAGPLSIIYAHIFTVGKIPSAWRIANITPVFKHGISSDVSNYRPISLTSVL